MYNFATTQHDHTTELRKVHIVNEETGKTLCGYRDMMLNGGDVQTSKQVQQAISTDVDNYLCGHCVKAFKKLPAGE